MKKEYSNPDIEIIRFCLSADVLDDVIHISTEKPHTGGDLGGGDGGGGEIDLDLLGGI